MNVVEVSFPMAARKIAARTHVVEDRDRVAMQRGPLVIASKAPTTTDRSGISSFPATQCSAKPRIRCCARVSSRSTPTRYLQCLPMTEIGRRAEPARDGDPVLRVGESRSEPDASLAADEDQGSEDILGVYRVGRTPNRSSVNFIRGSRRVLVLNRCSRSGPDPCIPGNCSRRQSSCS